MAGLSAAVERGPNQADTDQQDPHQQAEQEEQRSMDRPGQEAGDPDRAPPEAPALSRAAAAVHGRQGHPHLFVILQELDTKAPGHPGGTRDGEEMP